jgi:hypothetical protein
MGDVDNSRSLRGEASLTAPVETGAQHRTLTQMVIQSLRRNGAQGWIVMPPDQTDGCSRQRQIDRNRD